MKKLLLLLGLIFFANSVYCQQRPLVIFLGQTIKEVQELLDSTDNEYKKRKTKGLTIISTMIGDELDEIGFNSKNTCVRQITYIASTDNSPLAKYSFSESVINIVHKMNSQYKRISDQHWVDEENHMLFIVGSKNNTVIIAISDTKYFNKYYKETLKKYDH